MNRFFVIILLEISFLLCSCSNTLFIVKDTTPFVNKRAGILVVSQNPNLGESLEDEIYNYVENRLRNFSSFSKFNTRKETDIVLKENTQLLKQSELLITTMAWTGITDKNISKKLAKKLNIDQLFIFQIEEIPCKSCDGQCEIMIKARLVDANTGKLIWLGRDMFSLKEKERENKLKTYTMNKTTELIDDFTSEFLIPWNQLHYINLSQLKLSKNIEVQ